MKIAFFQNLPKGGALRVFEEQVKYFSKKHETEVFTVDIKLSGNRLKRDFDNFYELNKLHKKLAAKINKKNFDVVVVHHCKHTQAPFLLRYLDAPTLYYVEEVLRIAYEDIFAFTDKSNLFKYFYENTTRKFRKHIDYKNAVSANVIIANSMFTAKNIFKAYGKKVNFIHPAVDLKVFKPYKLKKQNQLIFVGGKDKINGYPLAVQIAKKANLKLKVIHGNKLTDRQLAKEYSKSLVTLALSYNEPFGLVPVESICCHTPVLAVNEGGHKETVINNENGFLLKRDLNAFVEKVKVIKKGYEFKFETENLDWNIHNKKLENVLTSLTNGKG